MTGPTPRPVRRVAIADHLWETFAEMAQAMGSDREALINQAMFMFARLNGFLEAGAAARGAHPLPASPPARVQAPAPTVPLPPVAGLTPPGVARALGGEDRDHAATSESARRQVAERVMETAAELERLLQDRGSTVPEGAAPPEPSAPAAWMEAPGPRTGQEPLPPGLYLRTEAGEELRVAKDRFVIGRGKHCDFVIHSSKVSREHAAITHEGDAYFIEDLDSSNGTWFQKQRIKRRRVEPGDEYSICSERIQLVLH